jgi:hypothetical protein
MYNDDNIQFVDVNIEIFVMKMRTLVISTHYIGNVDHSDENQPPYDKNMFDFETTNTINTARAGRVTHAPDIFEYFQFNLHTQGHEQIKYSDELAVSFVKTIAHYKSLMIEKETMKGQQFLETLSLNEGINKIRERGYDAAFDEAQQLHERGVLKPVYNKDLSCQERKELWIALFS